MKIDDSIFAVKLYEMEEQYGKLQCRIRFCEQGGSGKIHSELKKAEEEYKENTMLLEEKARSSRSLAVQRLIRAQLDYRQKTEDLMKDDIIKDIHSEDNSPEEDKTEADLLYAEFAMDFATLAMQQALISALAALDRQEIEGNIENTKEEKKGGITNGKDDQRENAGVYGKSGTEISGGKPGGKYPEADGVG
ncbi:hypothetical protein [[Ruminococcus] torques]|uniref:hypothetical protein n=1 Tax=[Ruminococcus] torques TaxID=33039 RepID=UPI0025A426B1|nr:hypothetical protein [[Ruminococcus] torques]MDM8235894.1 hypothetical protein [[Ruminococcus] torques]